MTAEEQWSVDVLDSVLAEYGQPSGSRRTGPKRENVAANDGRVILDSLFYTLYPEDLREQVTCILGLLEGKSFGSAEENRMDVDRLNRILRGTDLSMISELGTPVRLRLIKPARSAHGYFQLRSADAHQKSVYSGTAFPSVRVEFDV